MKKHFFLLALMCFTALSIFAQKPLLSESFESFNINSNSYSAIRWNPLSTDITVLVVENPNKTGINKTNKVLKIDRAENSSIVKPYEFTYRGATTNTYDFSKINDCVIELKVLKNVAGKLSMRFYSDGNSYKEVVSIEMPASSDWQLVKFDFGKIETPFTENAKLLIQPEKNANPASAQGAALTVYVDDIKMVQGKAEVAKPKIETNNSMAESVKTIDFSLWRVEDGNSGLVLNEMVKNPVKDAGISREKVLKVTKNGGSDAASWHNVSTKDIKATLTKDNCVVEMKILFPITGNSVSVSDIGLRLGDSYKGEVIQKVTAMDKWQTLQFIYSANSEFSSVFKLGKDSTITKMSFLPRRDKDQESSVVVFIGDLKFISK